jgi:hypothetical protein
MAMDVPLKFAIPLLLVAALPATYAVRLLPHAAPEATPVAAPRARAQPAYVVDEAALAREAAAVNEAHRARLAAAQEERDRADFELAVIRGQRASRDEWDAASKRWKNDEDDRLGHASAVREKLRVEGARATYCLHSRWHCVRP